MGHPHREFLLSLTDAHGRVYRLLLSGEETFDMRRHLPSRLPHRSIEEIRLPTNQCEADDNGDGGHYETDKNHCVHQSTAGAPWRDWIGKRRMVLRSLRSDRVEMRITSPA